MGKKTAERRAKHFHNKLDNAVENRLRKFEQGKLSLPSGAGRLVIVASQAIDLRAPIDESEQRRHVNELADRLAAERAHLHQEVVVARHVAPLVMNMDLVDPTVTDMILIGHGSIGNFWGENGVRIDWQDVNEAMSKRGVLKQGSIEQRTCGHFAVNTAVPWGTFAVSDQRNLVAATGVPVDDIRDDTMFKPIYDKPHNTVEDIIALNQRHRPITETEPSE